jgi:hypothetical protein
MAPEIVVFGHGQQVSGWRVLWLKYVSGFDHTQHCARCLIGSYSKRVTRDMPKNQPFALDEEPPPQYFYLCGVAFRGGWAANLHLAFVKGDAEDQASVVAYNGDTFVVRGAKALDIPELEKGFDDRPLAFTTCRNWRFGVARYGLSSTLQASAVPGPRFDHQAR